MTKQTNPEGFPSDLLLDLGKSANGRGIRARLEHALREAVQNRRLAAGTALPPTRVLAADLAVSRSVVVEVYRNLVADGYLESRPGAWTRVRGEPPAAPSRAGGGVPERARLFARPRRATTIQAPIRMLGGLPDASLFPRTSWARHYRAALAQVPNAQLTYPDLLGAEALRQALSRYLGRVRGVAATGEDVLICGGVTQGLALVCRALGRRGVRRIAVEDPCFGIHRSVIAMAGLEPVPVSVDADGLDPSRLRETDVEAILVAPAHSYPMGATLTAERRVELVRWARDRNAVIIEDDYDAEFRYDRAPIGALQGLAPDQVVHLGSASKTLTPALRLGWVVAPRDLLAQLAAEKHFDDMGSGLLEQITFARFIDRGDLARFLRRVRPVYRSRRDSLIAAVTELLPDATWTGEAAGLHLLVSLPPGVGERELTVAARERGVLIEDGSWHWASPDEAPPTVVLGYGATPEPTIRRAIALVAEALNDVRR